MEVKMFPVSIKSISRQHFIDTKKKKIKHHTKPSYPIISHIGLNNSLIINSSIDRSYGTQHSDDEPEKPTNYSRKRAISNSNYRDSTGGAIRQNLK